MKNIVNTRKIFPKKTGCFSFFFIFSFFLFSAILILFWLLEMTARKSTQAVSPPEKLSPPKESPIKILSAKPEEIIFAIDSADFQILEVEVEGKTYQKVGLKEAVLDERDEGKPALPLISTMVAIPKNSLCKSEIMEAVVKEIKNVEVIPAQPPQPDSVEEKLKFLKDENFYKQDEFYPAETVVIEKEKVFRGTAVRTIYFYPFSFNPAKKILRQNESFKVKLACQGGRTEGSGFPKESQNFFLPLKKRLTKNDQERGQPTPLLTELGEGADFLIITTSALKPAAENLALWRRQKGFLTVVKTTTDTGSTSEAIGSYLKNAYQTWNPAPSFVLLLGDAELIPTNYKTTHPYDQILIGTDLYYATVDGEDYLPDLAIGRISVDTLDQAQDRLSKIINYEKNPPTETEFYLNGGVAAYLQDDYPQDNYDDRPFIQTSEEIRDFLQSIGYFFQRLYNTNNLKATNYSRIYDEGRLLPPDLQPGSGFAWDANNTKISASVNNGIFWVNYRDHGNIWGWGHPAYWMADVDSLTNQNKLPLVASFTCQTGWFDNETDSLSYNDGNVYFGESWQRNQNGGAIGVVAFSRTSFSGHNDYLNKGFVDAIWPSFLSSSGSGNPIYFLGQDLTYAKIYYSTVYPDSLTRKIEMEMLHLLADPATEIWTGVPQNLTLSAPEAIGTGSNSLTVQVSEDGALVTVVQNSNLLGMAYSQGGLATIFLNPVAQEGTLTVTATKHNFRPVWQEVEVIKPNAVTLAGCWPYRYSEGKVMVYWESASEINNLGFNVYYHQTNDANGATIINSELIFSLSPGSQIGAEYSFPDANKPVTGYYWIESQDLGGVAEKFGPYGPYALNQAPPAPTGLRVRTSTLKNLLITWSGLPEKKYDLEISQIGSSGQIISTSLIPGILGNQYSRKPGLPAGRYLVRVREKYGEWSGYKSFTVRK